MRFKAGVNPEGVAREIWYALGFVDALSHILAGGEVTATSLNDGQHNPGSLHPQGRAADFRTREESPDVQSAIYAMLREWLGPIGFDVVLEDDHLHVEWDPKQVATLWRV